MKENKVIKKIYRIKDIENIEEKIMMLGNTKLDASSFMNIRLITTILVFMFSLYIFDLGYIYIWILLESLVIWTHTCLHVIFTFNLFI